MIINLSLSEVEEAIKEYVPYGYEIEAVTKITGVAGGLRVCCKKKGGNK